MLRDPNSLYEKKRSKTLLKVKKMLDSEGQVIAHVRGKGRLSHLMGNLVIRLPNGKEFGLGSGFNDAERANPPPIGSIVSFKYQELSENGIPRFPVFERIRTDLTWDDICSNSATVDDNLDVMDGSDVESDAEDGKAGQMQPQSIAFIPPNVQSKAQCWYGPDCYRKNPFHFQQYNHLHLKQ